ncbi:MAG: response regulator [Candidatus Marinimicrobia bacterium]|nr:response regulator [Candidatus Neomarinimicrobiota bacterium]
MSKRGKILWIDDEIDLLKPHLLYLEERGYEVEKVTNGRDAIVAVEETLYHLVLLDQVMPGMDGISTLREIKDICPALPVIMITKNEEEWLMDEAISEKISYYLTKPVNPSQIFLACKKVLEEEKLIEEKTASAYLKDFQTIESSLSSEMDIDAWWRLHVKLTDWQLEMDNQPDLGLGSILEGQIKTCNGQFVQFLLDHYVDWLHSSKYDRPTLSVDVLKTHVIPHLASGEKVFFLLVDCFRLDQVMAILPLIRRYFEVSIDYHVSLLPSATPFCRNAIFSGEYLSEIQNKYPELWNNMNRDDRSMNSLEKELLGKFLRKNGFKNLSFIYQKVNVAREGINYLNQFNDFMDVPFVSLVVNFIDILTHRRSESEILREMMPNESGYRSTVRAWFQNSWLYDIIKKVSDASYKLILTSDHGSTQVHRGVQVPGDRETSSGVRYKYGKNLRCPEKFGLEIKRPQDYFLPEMVTGTNYIIAKEDTYFVFPTQYHKFRSLFQGSFQHGGITMEEILVPTFTFTPK